MFTANVFCSKRYLGALSADRRKILLHDRNLIGVYNVGPKI